jgi:UDP-perosamine 4-acetyltransferase
MRKKIVILGAGGHARVLIDCLRFHSSVKIAGILDADPSLTGQMMDGVPVLGNDEMMDTLLKDGVSNFVVGLGGVGDNRPRQRLFEFALRSGLLPVVVTHPTAVISPGAEFGDGCQFLPGCIVNTGARLGVNVIVNSGAIIEHDCVVMDHVHVSTGARLTGGVHVEAGAHIGAGATIRQGIRIGANAVVGAGAVVIKDVDPNVTVAGVPARILEKVVA